MKEWVLHQILILLGIPLEDWNRFIQNKAYEKGDDGAVYYLTDVMAFFRQYSAYKK